MLYRQVRPLRRRGSSQHQFVQRIPADIKARAAGLKLHIPVGAETIPHTITAKAEAIRISLRTSDPSEIKRRQAQVAAYVEGVWQALRNDRPVPLTHRQAVALAGELYRGFAKSTETVTVAQWEADNKTLADGASHTADTPDEWRYAEFAGPLSGLQAMEADEVEAVLGKAVDNLLRSKGIAKVDGESRALVLRAARDALADAFASRVRNAEGDYSPDPKAARFPEWTPPSASTPNAQSAQPPNITLTGLPDAWWREAEKGGRSISTYETYRAVFGRLSAFLKHDDAAAVTPADIVAFKDHRLAEGISPKTVGDSDIAGLRSVFDWMVVNRKLPANPAKDIKVTRPKVTRIRDKGFSPEEAAAILAHSRGHQRGGREVAQTFEAKRWVPWLCAYTGARLGEMVQLRKQDLRRSGDLWVLQITPEANTVKDKEVRDIVLHEHLVELGFPEFVGEARGSYLFLVPPKSGEVRGVWRACKNRVREFVREVITDPNVAPNHGWRHAFKTVGREAGIADSVLDAICGHAARTVGGSYGSVSLKAQAEAMAKFPRWLG